MKTVALLGASGLVGGPLIRQLVENGARVLAYSREPRTGRQDGAEWRTYRDAAEPADCCISMVHLPEGLEVLPVVEASGARRLIQFSSTSQFTKRGSAEPEEVRVAERLEEGEQALGPWCEARGIAWTILRPTMIYGRGDRSISEIAGFIRRFGFFPRFGKAEGLRQPIASEDAATAAILAAGSPAAANRAYAIAGGEVLTYREMVRRIFAAMGKRPLMPPVPLAAFRLAVAGLRRVPRYGGWTASMAMRMNADLVFDNAPAARDFGFAPGRFAPGPFS